MEEHLIYLDLQLFAEEEKTEEATPKRKEEARKKGQVVKSNELNAAVNLISMMILFTFGIDYLFHKSFTMVQGFLMDFINFPLAQGQMQNFLLRFSRDYIMITAPIFLAAMGAGLVINYMQVGFLTSSETLQLKLDRLNPLEGLKRMFSRKALMELVKGILKITVISGITFLFIRDHFQKLIEILFLGVEGSVGEIISMFISLGTRVAMVFFGLAVLDYLFQRYEFQRSIKMSKHEVKEEHRQFEGDPQLKAKLKEKQREVTMNRVIQNVPKATVVVTNPTELAVALEYNQEKAQAPVITAKGAGTVARRIREIAKENQVPVVENRTVARLLYRQSKIGQEIPVELYQAVAEILAMVFRMKKKRSRR